MTWDDLNKVPYAAHFGLNIEVCFYNFSGSDNFIINKSLKKKLWFNF